MDLFTEGRDPCFAESYAGQEGRKRLTGIEMDFSASLVDSIGSPKGPREAGFSKPQPVFEKAPMKPKP